MYENLIQTYIESKADERRKKLEKWAQEHQNEYNDDVDFKKAFNAEVDKYKKMDIEAAKEKYKAISDSIESHSKAMQKHIEEFDDVFSLYPNNSEALGIKSRSNDMQNNSNGLGNESSDSNNSDILDNESSVRKIIGLSIKKTNAIIERFFKNFFSKGGE